MEGVASREVGGVDWRVAAPGQVAPVGNSYADVATAGGPVPITPTANAPSSYHKTTILVVVLLPQSLYLYPSYRMKKNQRGHRVWWTSTSSINRKNGLM